ncbi:hypothetical protein AOCH_007834 [Aspergillus ochraceoroseus]|nr:hypothetical protein AOCH_007834 [Aspergillus ochraceoroseus]
MVDDMGWWTIPIVSLVIFTLYGIEGIGSQLEDPFGYDRNDIKMDALVFDAKTEIDVVLAEWRKLMATVEAHHQTNGAQESTATDTSPSSPGKEHEFVMPDIFLRARPQTARQ